MEYQFPVSIVVQKGHGVYFKKHSTIKKKMIQKFLNPNPNKILIFVIFLFIAFAGYTQSYVFSGKDTGSPEPPLYDLLEPFPFWAIWVLLILPLTLLSGVIVTVGGYDADFIMRGPFWLFMIIQLIYFYILSCSITFIRAKLTGNQRLK